MHLKHAQGAASTAPMLHSYLSSAVGRRKKMGKSKLRIYKEGTGAALDEAEVER